MEVHGECLATYYAGPTSTPSTPWHDRTINWCWTTSLSRTGHIASVKTYVHFVYILGELLQDWDTNIAIRRIFSWHRLQPAQRGLQDGLPEDCQRPRREGFGHLQALWKAVHLRRQAGHHRHSLARAVGCTGPRNCRASEQDWRPQDSQQAALVRWVLLLVTKLKLYTSTTEFMILTSTIVPYHRTELAQLRNDDGANYRETEHAGCQGTESIFMASTRITGNTLGWIKSNRLSLCFWIHLEWKGKPKPGAPAIRKQTRYTASKAKGCQGDGVPSQALEGSTSSGKGKGKPRLNQPERLITYLIESNMRFSSCRSHSSRKCSSRSPTTYQGSQRIFWYGRTRVHTLVACCWRTWHQHECTFHPFVKLRKSSILKWTTQSILAPILRIYSRREQDWQYQGSIRSWTMAGTP